MPLPWPFPHYEPLGGGIGAIRFDFNKIEHRLYGYFGSSSDQFTIVLASSDKKRQRRDIAAAKELKKQYDLHRPDVEEYDV